MAKAICPEEEAEKKQTAVKSGSILFICTGNTCRSPMAEAIFNNLYKHSGKRAFSRGLIAFGECISPYAVRALQNLGVLSNEDNDYLSHVAENVSEEDIRKADEVIAMTNDQLMTLIFSYPSFSSKFSLFREEVPDPYGKGQADYDRCAEVLTSLIKERFNGKI